jgi:hypothetical protein
MNNKSKLEKVLKKFEHRIMVQHPEMAKYYSKKDIGDIITDLEEKALEHPGLYKLAWLDIHIHCLKVFLDECEKVEANPEMLLEMAKLVSIGYSENDLDLPFYNLLLEIEGEIGVPPYLGPENRTEYSKRYFKKYELSSNFKKDYNEAITKDLKKNASDMTLGKIKKLEKDIKILETLRAKILATAALFDQSKNTSITGDQKSDIMLRLLRIWTRFKITGEKLVHSDSLGDLIFALDENHRRMDNSETIPKLSKLPGRLQARHWDYFVGSKGRDQYKFKHEVSGFNDKTILLKDTKNKKITDKPGKFGRKKDDEEELEEHITFVNIDKDNETEQNKMEALLPTSAINIKDLDVKNSVKKAMQKLSPTERKAIQKEFMNGKTKLTSAERKAKSRAIPKLRKILKKDKTLDWKNTA